VVANGNPHDDLSVRVVIKDLDPKPKFHLVLPASTTVAQVYFPRHAVVRHAIESVRFNPGGGRLRQ